MHPDFDGGFHSDIALIKLKKRVNFTKNVRPLCIKDVPQHVSAYLAFISLNNGYRMEEWNVSQLDGERQGQLIRHE